MCVVLSVVSAGASASPSLDSDHYLAWLALALAPGLGARMAGKLLREFGRPDAIFAAPLTTLEAQRLPAAVAQAIHTRLESCGQGLGAGAWLLTWDEPEYPGAATRDRMIYVLGNVELLAHHSIAIVGSRRPTSYGNQMDGQGIDSSAHYGALSSSSGNHDWGARVRDWCGDPKENKVLEAIQKRGATLSEFPIGTFPAPQDFPIPNRAIAGIALGVVVVEGAQYSGSLITARLAMEFGREVYGVRGNATQPSSLGPNQLIKQGAKLVTGWEDVVEELSTLVHAKLVPVETEQASPERALLVEEGLWRRASVRFTS